MFALFIVLCVGIVVADILSDPKERDGIKEYISRIKE